MSVQRATTQKLQYENQLFVSLKSKLHVHHKRVMDFREHVALRHDVVDLVLGCDVSLGHHLHGVLFVLVRFQ